MKPELLKKIRKQHEETMQKKGIPVMCIDCPCIGNGFCPMEEGKPQPESCEILKGINGIKQASQVTVN